MVIGSKEFNSVFEDFTKSRDWLNDVTVEIVDGPANLSPLELLRRFEAEPTLDNNLTLTTQMIMNREVRFIKDDKIIHSFIYNGGDLGAKFTDKPWLLDVLMKVCYGLMVKKLTPPSSDSGTEERPSEKSKV